jgi:hypothetical protein
MPVLGAANPPSAAKPTPLYTRMIKLNPEPLLSKMSNFSSAADGNSSQGVFHQEALRQFFKDLGVEIEPPATVYMEKTGTLTVHTSLENLDKIESINSTLGFSDQKR